MLGIYKSSLNLPKNKNFHLLKVRHKNIGIKQFTVSHKKFFIKIVCSLNSEIKLILLCRKYKNYLYININKAVFLVKDVLKDRKFKNVDMLGKFFPRHSDMLNYFLTVKEDTEYLVKKYPEVKDLVSEFSSIVYIFNFRLLKKYRNQRYLKPKAKFKTILFHPLQDDIINSLFKDNKYYDYTTY